MEYIIEYVYSEEIIRHRISSNDIKHPHIPILDKLCNFINQHRVRHIYDEYVLDIIQGSKYFIENFMDPSKLNSYKRYMDYMNNSDYIPSFQYDIGRKKIYRLCAYT